MKFVALVQMVVDIPVREKQEWTLTKGEAAVDQVMSKTPKTIESYEIVGIRFKDIDCG
jgi:hypothetical protein